MTRGGLSLSKYVWDNGASEVLGYAPSIMANSELTWETTKQWNVGIDFGFLNNRLSGTVDLYLQHTSIYYWNVRYRSFQASEVFFPM